MTLSLAFDHRLVDGQAASRFLAAVGEVLSDPTNLIAFGLRRHHGGQTAGALRRTRAGVGWSSGQGRRLGARGTASGRSDQLVLAADWGLPVARRGARVGARASQAGERPGRRSP